MEADVEKVGRGEEMVDDVVGVREEVKGFGDGEVIGVRL